MIDCLCRAIRTTIIELSVIHSRTSRVTLFSIILERDSVEGRCMQMSDKFCVMHLKYLSCVSLHIAESSFVIESLTMILTHKLFWLVTQSSSRYKWNCFSIKDDGNAAKLSKHCTESLSLSEKEIARILGPQSLGFLVSCELDSMETFGENHFCFNNF